MRRLLIALLSLILLATSSQGAPFRDKDVPEVLKDWIPWALHGEEGRECPSIYNNASTHRCSWPSTMEIRTSARQATFSQLWEVNLAGWIVLPGSSETWPTDVKLNGIRTPVANRNGRPAVWAEKGIHRISGAFEWTQPPNFIFIGNDTALVSGTISGRRITEADIDRDGKLYLNRQPAAPTDEPVAEHLVVQVYRLLIDDIPFTEVTRFQIDVAGAPREVSLKNGVRPGMLPLRVDSVLPMRVEPDGVVKLQVRPGTWTFEVESRSTGPVNELTVPPTPAMPAEEEIWIFEEKPELRLVAPQGLTAVDPSQTNVPAEWSQRATYLARPGETLKLAERQRGQGIGVPNQLSINRRLYLDFSGEGYSVQDELSGQLHTSRRLEALPSLSLGRVSVDGQPQMITRREGSNQDGVELRRGQVSLNADARYEKTGRTVPVTGWDTDVRSVGNFELNLPPGWRLFGAIGPDRTPAWLSSWNLLDFFVVIILVLASRHFWGMKGAALALVTLVLTWKEGGSPKYVYLHLVAAVALVRALPEGRFQRFARIYKALAALAFIVIAVPYMVGSVRLALYPQLAYQGPGEGYVDRSALTEMEAPADKAMVAEEPAIVKQDVEGLVSEVRKSMPSSVAPRRGRAPDYSSYRYDKSALIQTGLGIPQFRQNRMVLRWDGPVSRDETVTLLLFNPLMTALWILLGVLAVAAYGFQILGTSLVKKPGLGRGLFAGLALVVFLLVPAGNAGADIPSADLLAELKRKLLVAPECAPECAQSPQAIIQAEGKDLIVRYSVESQDEVAVPVPASPSNWMPSLVLIDGKEATGMYRERDVLWVKVGKGVHQVVISGPIGDREKFQLPLLLKPARVTAVAKGWQIRGIRPDGVPQGPVYIERIKNAEEVKKLDTFEAGRVPPFVRVTRIVNVDLDLTLQTIIERVSPTGEGINIELPLLEGESVVTDGVRVEAGKAVVSMGPYQGESSWNSVQENSGEFHFKASTNPLWIETWQLNVSPLWHLEQTAGIPEIHQGDPNGQWVPTWRPWPGEEVTLKLSRPTPVEGRTLTVDQVSTRVRPGKRETEVTVAFSARSTRGVQHSINLPAGAELHEVQVDGKVLPVRANEDGEVVVPLLPKSQQVSVTFLDRSPMAFRWNTPSMNLGAPSVNASVEVEVPRDRWLLFAGSKIMKLGPAVLIYGVILVAILGALVLAAATKTPLRFHSWILLLIGFTQVPVTVALVVVGWIILLSLRERMGEDTPASLFNLVQVVIAALTLMSLYFFYIAVSHSLLGFPEMWIAGNGSSSFQLRWYVDRAEELLPHGWIVSLPLYVYRGLMLAWSLFVASLLLKILRWGYGVYSQGGYWKHDPGSFKLKRDKKASVTPPPAEPKKEEKGK